MSLCPSSPFMQMKRKIRKDPRRMTSGSDDDINGGAVIGSRNARRRRLEIRRLKCTCETMMNITITGNGDVNGIIPGGDDRRVKKLQLKNKEENLNLQMSLALSSSTETSEENVVVSALGEKTCKKTDGSRNFTCMSHGLLSVIGRRREMEDAVRVELGFMGKGGERYDFYGVYDGHGGSRVAEACKERLHVVLAEGMVEEEGENGFDWEQLMVEGFEKMDEEVNRGRFGEEMVGSTAVVAVVGKEKLVVANCGDSRAVLSRGGNAVALSCDHKPDRPDELERVEAAGGRVINWNGHRVLGVLATSRSIGDQYLKPFVISKPEVTVSELTDHDEFLILASDGLWDVISNELACRVVRRCLNGQLRRKSLEAGNENRTAEAAAILVELAITRGSKDNISVIVVELRKPSTPLS